jgi:hypothetical protein
VDPDQPFELYHQAYFFTRLTDSRLRKGLPRIHFSAGQAPDFKVPPFGKQYFPILDDDDIYT